MTLAGSRVVGALVAWLGGGFFVDLALLDTVHEAVVEAGLEAGPAPTGTLRVVLTALGLSCLALGMWLVAREPGEAWVAEDASGAPVLEDRPRSCWRCREPWPREAARCPSCGAKRLR